MVADPRTREEHDHILPIHRQCRSDLRADEPAADDREALALFGQRAQPLIIVERAIVDHVIAAPGEAPWGAAGRQEQLVKGVDRSLVIRHAFVRRIKRLGRSPQVEIDALRCDIDPDALQRLAFPERLRERRALIGWVRVHARSRPIAPVGSTSRIPWIAAAAVMPPPIIR